MRQRWSGADKFAHVLGLLFTILFFTRPSAADPKLRQRSDLQTQEAKSVQLVGLADMVMSTSERISDVSIAGLNA